MGKVSFLFGNHNHQPIGNFEHVFEEAYQRSYAPFLRVLLRHPGVKWNLHCTGILWEWIEARHPDFFADVKTMVDRGQLELLSGGFYEPILPILPDEDKVGQIRKLNRYLEDRFGAVPKGMWCAERIWEPYLPKPLREAGIEYTLLDDTHFLAAGLRKEDLNGYFKVEEQDRAIDVFPIHHDLRFAIPFWPLEKATALLRRLAAGEGERLLVMVDDGEKFGLWPDTYEQVYEKSWLEKFLRFLEDNGDWIQTETFSGYRARRRARGKAYLPAASYFEMSQWALPAEAQLEFEAVIAGMPPGADSAQVRKFLKGGIWRNFLTKYPESNGMYRKMLRVSHKLHEAVNAAPKRGKKELEPAFDHLWAGQCNCSYWHGVFGGLYLPFLRQAVYKHLIEAEKSADAAAPKAGRPAVAVEVADHGGDGGETVIVETPVQNLYIAPFQGGAVTEWDFKPAGVNLANVLTRRPEAYHKKIRTAVGKDPDRQASTTGSAYDLLPSKQKGLDKLLQYDWYQRLSLLDHFLHPDTDLESFQKCQYGEQGDFVLEAYERRISKRPPQVRLARRGSAWSGQMRCDLEVEKTLSFPEQAEGGSARLELLYRVSNRGAQAAEGLWFAPEFNFAFSVFDPKSDASFQGRESWLRADPHLGWSLKIGFPQPQDAWIFPLETISSSEGGFEKTYQGTVFVPHWKFSLPAGGSFTRALRFEIERK